MDAEPYAMKVPFVNYDCTLYPFYIGISRNLFRLYLSSLETLEGEEVQERRGAEVKGRVMRKVFSAALSAALLLTGYSTGSVNLISIPSRPH